MMQKKMEQKEREHKKSGHKKSVLIVDDKSVNRYVLRNLFEDEYEITECVDGKEAIAVLEEQGEKTAVVLLDIVMPIYDGFTVLEYMQAKQLQNVPVVLISSNVNDENIRKAYTYEVADYIQKPFEEDIVKRRVERIINLFEKKRSK